MEPSGEFWTSFFHFLEAAPQWLLAAMPGLGALYLALVATRANRENPPAKTEPQGDSDKLDKILSELATLRADLAHLAKMEASVQTLIKDVAHIEGRLDARK
jgi:hypothetical protein